MMLLKWELSLLVEYSLVDTRTTPTCTASTTHTALFNFHYVSKISIHLLCLKILDITGMAEVFFDLYSQSQICITILMLIYYQIKVPFEKSVQVFLCISVEIWSEIVSMSFCFTVRIDHLYCLAM